MVHHLPAAEQDESRVMLKSRGEVMDFHPALSLPAHEFDFFCGQMLSANDSRGAIIFLEPIVDDQTLVAEFFRHWRARIWRWVLDVGPIHVAPGKFEIRLNRCARIARTADDQS